ncbi:MAG: DUF3047 domain-containing protein [Longimicrobiales bacterium]|nr:DUF3047 domain-containing protein [Longimicrobiales bacterium]
MNRDRLILGLLALCALPVSVLLANQTPPGPFLFDDFSRTEVGQFPRTWRWRRDNDTGDAEKARKDGVDVFRYVVASEGGNKYVHVRDEFRPGSSVALFIQTDDSGWRLDRHPILSWRWRVNEVPAGADERYTDTNDTPAAVSVVYGTKFPFTPITIRWVWSSTLPVGAVAYRPGRGRAYNLVLGSGSDRLGEWVTVERNLVEDYVAIFGKQPPNEPKAITIQSDANRTPGGAADADYDDFRALAAYSPGFPKEPFVLLKQYMQGNR